MNLIEFKQKNAGVSVKPILFSTEMVKAILEGRKTQTRRILKPQPEHNNLRHDGYDYEDGQKHWFEELKDGEPTENYIEAGKCPYGKQGDILWVRESFFDSEPFGHFPLLVANNRYLYRANDEFIGEHKWKPSIHMPFEAARIFLRVKWVKIKRLKDITPMDCAEEGIEISTTEGIMGKYWRHYLCKNLGCITATESFKTLWQLINGPDSWDANPWVWVVVFEKIDINK